MKKWFERLGDPKLREQARSLVSDARSAVQQAVTGALEEPIFFLHFEKCGGTAIDEAMRRAYRTLDVSRYEDLVKLDASAAYRAAASLGEPTWAYRERLARYYLERERTRFVTGHFQVSRSLLEHYAPDVAFVTVLREPVSKFVSHYFFNRYKDDEHGRIEVDLSTYLETERAADVGADYVQLLCGRGDQPAKTGRRPEVIEESKRVLEQFDLVGLLEDMPRFLKRFEARFGTSLTLLERNRNPVGRAERREELTPELIERIREINAPNIALYEHARGLDRRA